MRIKDHPLYSIALGAVYLSMLQMYSAHGMETFSQKISDKTFLARYIARNLLKNWIHRPTYTYEIPFKIPQDLPPPEEIANTVAQQIGAQNFLRGASTSAHQCGKLCRPEICSWSRFAQQYNLAQPTDPRYQMDWDKQYKAYIDYAKDTLHLNALRFSIEWPLVQPENPERTDQKFDEQMLTHYAGIFRYMIKRGITPIVCFHHYTDPCWFIDGGGFESPENLKYFVGFCNKVYISIMEHVRQDHETIKALQTIHPLWTTYNAPEGYAFRGYRQKQGPPSIASRSGLPIVAEVLKNMLEAHVQVYQAIKKSYHDMNLASHQIPSPKIGFLKNIHQIDPAHETWLQYLASPFTRLFVSVPDMIQNGAIYIFFTTGTFQVHIPFAASIKHYNSYAPQSLDFIGLNYYANRHMVLMHSIKPTDANTCSDNEWYYRYPQGIYRAIIEISENLARPLKIPIFIAENGIATTDDKKRAQFYHEYLYAIYKAFQDGYPIFGYLPWTLADNYEWPTPENNTKRDYGLCAVPAPEKLVAKEGSKPYFAFTQQLHQLERAP